MPSNLPIYPNADQSGNPLPYDIVRSISTMKLSFTATALNDVVIPAAAEIVNVYGDSDVGCYILLSEAGTNIELPTSGVPVAGLHFIPALAQKCIDKNNAAYIAIISLTDDAGIIHVEFAKQWRDGKNIQQRQRT